MTDNTPLVERARFDDDFRGDTVHLLNCAKALLELDDENALIPHGLGGHAKNIINALAARLTASLPTIEQIDKLREAAHAARDALDGFVERWVQSQPTSDGEGSSATAALMRLTSELGASPVEDELIANAERFLDSMASPVEEGGVE